MRILFVLLVACGSKTTHVELPSPLPSPEASSAATPALDDIACTPQPMAAIDVADLASALAQSRDFAQRCCTGDENGDAIVRITPAPSGYQTSITIEPESIATSSSGACVHAVFHRLLVKPYDGSEKTTSITVRLR